MWTDKSEAKLEKAGESLENAAIRKNNRTYVKAVNKALRELQPAVKELKKLERQPLNMTDEQYAKWKDVQTREILRRYDVIKTLANAMAAAGQECVEEIRKTCNTVYDMNAEE